MVCYPSAKQKQLESSRAEHTVLAMDLPPEPTELLASLQVTAEEQKKIASYPQRGAAWHKRRLWMLGSSMFGKASGHMGASKQRELACQMVWPELNQGLTGYAAKLAQHGVDHEDMVRDMYTAHRRSPEGRAVYLDGRCRVFETGLVVSLEHGWMGASPDFVVEEVVGARASPATMPPPRNPHHQYDPFIISHPFGYGPYMSRTPLGEDANFEGEQTVLGGGEIKCPAAQKNVLYSEQPQHQIHGFPVQYFDQIQGAMAVNGWKFCDAVVHTTQRTEVTRFFFDSTYWETVLFPAVEDFYKGTFLRLLQLRREGKLEPGRIDASPKVPRKISKTTAIRTVATEHPDIIDPLEWWACKPLHVVMIDVPKEGRERSEKMAPIVAPFADFFS